MIIVEDYKLEFNSELVNIQMNVSSDRISDPIVNIRLETFVTLTKLFAYATIHLPQDQNDDKYRTEFIKTVIDIEKLLKGITGNIIVKSFLGDLFKSITFKPKFPFAPVSFMFLVLFFYPNLSSINCVL